MRLEGKPLKDKKFKELKEKIEVLKKDRNVTPEFNAIIVGEEPEAMKYISMKEKACKKLGIRTFTHTLPANVREADLLYIIQVLNTDPNVNGILVQLPLPKHINTEKVLCSINPEKDVDGFHPMNVGRLQAGLDVTGRVPCTAAGIIELIESTKEPIKGKKAVVIGRSNIVGRPVARLLDMKGAHVTICHSRTPHSELIEELRRADIIVCAVGIPGFLTKGMVGFNQIIIDVGTNFLEDGTQVGDVVYDEIAPTAKYISPSPGGVGPTTISKLMENIVENTRRLL